MLVIGAVVVVVLVALYAMATFNNLVKRRNQVADAWVGHRRAAHPARRTGAKPRRDGEGLQAARAGDPRTRRRRPAPTRGAPRSTGEAEERCSQAVGSLLAVAEAYPDLKANDELPAAPDRTGHARGGHLLRPPLLQRHRAQLQHGASRRSPSVLVRQAAGLSHRRILPSRPRRKGGTECAVCRASRRGGRSSPSGLVVFGTAMPTAESIGFHVDDQTIDMAIQQQRRRSTSSRRSTSTSPTNRTTASSATSRCASTTTRTEVRARLQDHATSTSRPRASPRITRSATRPARRCFKIGDGDETVTGEAHLHDQVHARRRAQRVPRPRRVVLERRRLRLGDPDRQRPRSTSPRPAACTKVACFTGPYGSRPGVRRRATHRVQRGAQFGQGVLCSRQRR